MKEIHVSCAGSTADGGESKSLQFLPGLTRAVSFSLVLQQGCCGDSAGLGQLAERDLCLILAARVVPDR